MKRLINLLLVLFALQACNNVSDTSKVNSKQAVVKEQRFFPVTSYLKGQIYNIKSSGIKLKKYTTVDGKTDSAFIKLVDLDSTLAEFLTPQIDTANLVSLFTESSFFDQSINSVTFTYQPTTSLPDSMTLKHWDVYIDPETSSVKRIYMVKEISKAQTLQLTWLSNQWCTITSLVTGTDGITKVEKEVKIIWDFNL